MVSKLGGYKLGILMLSIGLIPTAIVAVLVGFGTVSFYVAALSIAAGIAIAFGDMLFYKAMETEQISNSMVFSELGSVLFVVFGFFVFGEAIGAVGAIGATIVFIGATLVAITEDRKFNKRLMPAMIAVIMWSSGFIVLSYSISASGTLSIPIIITRISSLVFFVVGRKVHGIQENRNQGCQAHRRSVCDRSSGRDRRDRFWIRIRAGGRGPCPA